MSYVRIYKLMNQIQLQIEFVNSYNPIFDQSYISDKSTAFIMCKLSRHQSGFTIDIKSKSKQILYNLIYKTFCEKLSAEICKTTTYITTQIMDRMIMLNFHHYFSPRFSNARASSPSHAILHHVKLQTISP